MTNQGPDWISSPRMSMDELRDYATELNMTDFSHLNYEDLTAAVIKAQKAKLDGLGLGQFS